MAIERINRSMMIEALKSPGAVLPVQFKEVLKKLNTQLGLQLETPAQVMAVKFLKHRFDRNPVLQNQFGSFESFLKSVGQDKIQKLANKIESRFLSKVTAAQLKTFNFSQINFEDKNFKELTTELDQEMDLVPAQKLISQDMFLEPASSDDFKNHDGLQQILLGLNQSKQEVINTIRKNRLEQDLVEQKLREKRQLALETQKKIEAKVELVKEQELNVLSSKKMANPVSFMMQKELILGEFNRKRSQAGLQTA